ncbi:SelT/SelW/SelH family protein [Aquirufa echingensis]|jgi:selenoprotein W-related protein|uniref:SelT/SelW/SelH family protein n=1 Tax=Aquirufa echingensis TaxID=3096516 RepID=A0ABW6CUK8_9BACT
MKKKLRIRYCPQCHWLLRATYVAQELLTTFEKELGGICLEPSDTAGEFAILCEDDVLFDRKTNGGFEEIKIIKQLVRDYVCPEKPLGHSDK